MRRRHRRKRLYWIRHEANLFVARHQEEIVDVASRLYERGIITLEAPNDHCQRDDALPSSLP
jgi:hypothetical protein